MLEIGCASGAFMHEMAQAGWDVAGIEISPAAARHAQIQGYQVQIGSVESASYEPNSFDLIVGWMVLEHLHDPIQCLTRMRQWVRPGGWLAISVPNVDSWEFKHFTDAWYALQLPTHLFHFSPKSATMLLKNTGWAVQGVFQQRVITDILASIGFRLMDKALYKPLARFLATIPEHKWNLNYVCYPLGCAIAALSLSGRMTIWAENSVEHNGSTITI
jgi:SAM-dependent methyltransferase